MKVTLQKPTDQPTGVNRLIDQLKDNLSNDEFDTFRFVVAFAKSGPFLRLENLFSKWRKEGKRIEAVFGVDEKGTSQQALEFAMENFNATYISHFNKSSFASTFHPKFYHFFGKKKGIFYIGSNNFTVGGLETNAECSAAFELDLPADEKFSSQVNEMWSSTIAVSRPLDKKLLNEMVGSKLVVNEKEMLARRLVMGKLHSSEPITIQPIFPLVKIIPPSPIPRTVIIKKSTKILRSSIPIKQKINIVAQALAIQIIPHYNGEILLSKSAVDQNPDFFGFPFTGKTIPKKNSNPSYPQRIPDPTVRITIHDSREQQVVNIPKYPLNMVFYKAKSEIRITVPQDVIKNTPEYSIMVMNQNAPDESLDYGIDIYVPGSESYNKYLTDCNQEMPGGGKEIPRRFGWI